MTLKKLHNALVKEYETTELAEKAIRWLIENHSNSFIRSIKPFEFIKSNEYLWRN